MAKGKIFAGQAMLFRAEDERDAPAALKLGGHQRRQIGSETTGNPGLRLFRVPVPRTSVEWATASAKVADSFASSSNSGAPTADRASRHIGA